MTVASALASIIVVMIVYHVLLSATHHPAGISVLTNICLHYLSPPIFAAWWYTSERDGILAWRNLWQFSIFPVIYLVYVYLREPIAHEFPYDFLNYNLNGVAGVVLIVLIIFAVYQVLGLAIITLDKASRKN